MMQRIRTTITAAVMILCLTFLSCALSSNRNDSATKDISPKNEASPTTPGSINGNNTNRNIQPASTSTFTGPTAVEIGEALKSANIFPKTTEVSDTTKDLSTTDRDEGAVSSATAAGVTIRVYHSIDERHQARLRLVKECPGCNALTECGVILMYQPYTKADDINKILRQKSQEYFGVLKRQYKCE